MYNPPKCTLLTCIYLFYYKINYVFTYFFKKIYNPQHLQPVRIKARWGEHSRQLLGGVPRASCLPQTELLSGERKRIRHRSRYSKSRLLSPVTRLVAGKTFSRCLAGFLLDRENRQISAIVDVGDRRN